MVDYFALLDEPRRPWIDPDKLKAKLVATAAEVHPDRVHTCPDDEKLNATGRSAQLNAAYQCLGEPKARVLHLLELELGAKPKEIERTPQAMMDLFFQIGPVLRDVDGFLAERAKVASPLLRVQRLEQGLGWMDELNALLRTIKVQRERMFEELQAMNVRWETAQETPPPERREALPLDRLEQIYRVLSYLSRWSDQIQARLLELSL
ncbi:MAG: hypothetical protein HY735_37815 [Verrucomicrobia bacterium]|nr:hypothetical protein [Verrucomicrobiota bacterium]